MINELFRLGRWPKMAEWRRADPEGRRPTAQTVTQVFGSWTRAKYVAGADRAHRRGGRTGTFRGLRRHGDRAVRADS